MRDEKIQLKTCLPNERNPFPYNYTRPRKHETARESLSMYTRSEPSAREEKERAGHIRRKRKRARRWAIIDFIRTAQGLARDHHRPPVLLPPSCGARA